MRFAPDAVGVVSNQNDGAMYFGRLHGKSAKDNVDGPGGGLVALL